MKLYHYQSLDKYDEVKHSGLKTVPIGMRYKPATEQYGVFCLDAPEPEAWTRTAESRDLFQKLLNRTGELLLEIEVDDLDSVYVLDWMKVQRQAIEALLSDNPENAWLKLRSKGEKEYLDSKLPMADFITDRSSAELPEFVIFNNVPAEKISVSSEQPAIRAKLMSVSGEERDVILNKLRKIPELAFLVKKFDSLK